MTKKTSASRPANQNDDKKSAGAGGSWEVKSVLFILRIIAAIAFFLYLFQAVPATFIWAQMVHINKQPVENIETLAAEAVAQGETERILNWVRFRPAEDTPYIIKTLEKHTGVLPSLVFVTYSRNMMQLGDMEEAVFWLQYARYRLRFDEIRCGDATAQMPMEVIYALVFGEKMDDAINKQAHEFPATIRRVLAYDADWPAANTPDSVCALLRHGAQGKNSSIALMPAELWPAARHRLRYESEAALQRIEADAQRRGTVPSPAAAENAVPAAVSGTPENTAPDAPANAAPDNPPPAGTAPVKIVPAETAPAAKP